jgi:hypothetical protein
MEDQCSERMKINIWRIARNCLPKGVNFNSDQFLHRVIVGFVTEDTLPMLSSMLLFEGNIERIRVLHNF